MRVPRLIPPDSLLCSHSVIKAKYGYSEVETRPCFTPKRSTRSEQLLADVKRVADQQSNPSNINRRINNGLTTSLPIKMRSTVRTNNELPMRGIPSVCASKISGGFTNEPKKFQRHITKREGGAMLIDMSEVPMCTAGGRHKRIQPIVVSTNKQPLEKGGRAGIPPIKSAAAVKGKGGDDRLVEVKLGGEPVKHHKEQEVGVRMEMEDGSRGATRPKVVREGSPTSYLMQMEDNDDEEEAATTSSASATAAAPSQPTAASSRANVPIRPAPPPPEQQQQHQVNQMAAKQIEELLKTSNRLTSVSYNLIASFLSGNKDNPLQNKLGAVVTLPLSESVELESLPLHQQHQHQMVMIHSLVETFFQMDYNSGEWKRLKKSRPLRPDEVKRYMQGGALQQQPSSSHQNQQQQDVAAPEYYSPHQQPQFKFVPVPSHQHQQPYQSNSYAHRQSQQPQQPVHNPSVPEYYVPQQQAPALPHNLSNFLIANTSQQQPSNGGVPSSLYNPYYTNNTSR